MIVVTLEGPKGIAKLASLPELVRNELFKGLMDGAELITQTSQKKYLSGPYPKVLTPDTGLLRAKGPFVYAGISNIPGELGRITAKAGVWYGKVHEQFGEKTPFGFPIYAKGKPMVFFWKRRGFWVHTYKVTIPPRPWLKPAILESAKAIGVLIRRMMSQAYKLSKNIP